jgi:Asp/Glu/hydantoin racemase
MSVVALIHTSPSMIPVFKPLCDELIGKSARVFNMVDESLLCDIIESGRCPPATARRLAGHVVAAADAGADVILVTCSSMGPAVEAARVMVPATVVRADEAMVDRAIATGSRIGIIATLPSTLAPTEALVRSTAQARSKDVTIRAEVVDGAFAAVIGGDAATHDRLVGEAVRTLAPTCDVILLAQASMARAVDAHPRGEVAIPVLASPRLAVERVAEIVRKRAIS